MPATFELRFVAPCAARQRATVARRLGAAAATLHVAVVELEAVAEAPAYLGVGGCTTLALDDDSAREIDHVRRAIAAFAARLALAAAATAHPQRADAEQEVGQ